MDYTFNHLGLCAGYGGIDLGLERVLPACRTVAHVEIEAFAIANLVSKMEAGELAPAPVWTDLHTFPFDQFLGVVDIITAGFPCQPFSQAGKREGVEDKRHLWPRIAEGVRRSRPTLVFMENVDGIASAKSPGFESVLHHVLSDLEGMGYRSTAGLYTAHEVGAPHQRKRWFILGMADRDHYDEQVTSQVHQGNNARGEEPDRHCLRLADPDDGLSNSSHGEIRAGRGSLDGSGLGGVELADPRRLDREVPLGRFISTIQEPRGHGTPGRTWPAGPRQDQHTWEEPRTTEPGVGGAVDGSACGLDPALNRVDRLRLLGNGVVPDQAAKAFVELLAEVSHR